MTQAAAIHTLEISGLSEIEVVLLGATAVGMILNAKKSKLDLIPGGWDETIAMSEKILAGIKKLGNDKIDQSLMEIETAMNITQAEDPCVFDQGRDHFYEAGEKVADTIEHMRDLDQQVNDQLTNTNHG